ncbi:60S ribosomal protein L29-like [Cricetulus griseus]|uniref:60S ribosomal protein L29-like n=1 Tax=Cricetulus griseus TaxID=10029 RepID=A0A061ILB3_CRIGR|nr:60S ribosomal protein L29-like [Cricetulus griseus]ERE84560.1 60S ribosomal protein L29-like protein [Cricetulus griseus]
MEVDPKFLRKMWLVKKHSKKHLKKMRSHNVKAMSACSEAIEDFQSQRWLSPGCHKAPAAISVTWLPSLTPIGKWIRNYMAKFQTKEVATALPQAQASAPAQAPKGPQAPAKDP